MRYCTSVFSLYLKSPPRRERCLWRKRVQENAPLQHGLLPVLRLRHNVSVFSSSRMDGRGCRTNTISDRLRCAGKTYAVSGNTRSRIMVFLAPDNVGLEVVETEGSRYLMWILLNTGGNGYFRSMKSHYWAQVVSVFYGIRIVFDVRIFRSGLVSRITLSTEL